MAEELGPLFLDQPEVRLFWILGVLIAGVAAVVAIWALLQGGVSSDLGWAGLVLMPALALLIANLVVVNRSRETQFCGSCHQPMSPLVASLPLDNGSLASIHFRGGAVKTDTACYSCHSGYGLLGDINAKLSGLGHMWHEATGRYDYPLEMSRPFDIDACLDCHRNTVRFRTIPSHTDAKIQLQLVSREISCTGVCHPSAHPADTLRGAGGEP